LLRSHIGDLFDGLAGGDAVGHFHDGALGIAVQQQVGLGVHQDGAAHLVLPVVVVGDAAQRGLDAAHDEGHVGVGFLAALRIDQRGAIGPLAAFAAGRVGVVTADLAIGGVAVDHGIHVARGHAVEQIGLAQRLEGVGAVPLGLRDDAHAKALGLQHAADHGHAEAGVVHIG